MGGAKGGRGGRGRGALRTRLCASSDASHGRTMGGLFAATAGSDGGVDGGAAFFRQLSLHALHTDTAQAGSLAAIEVVTLDGLDESIQAGAVVFEQVGVDAVDGGLLFAQVGQELHHFVAAQLAGVTAQLAQRGLEVDTEGAAPFTQDLIEEHGTHGTDPKVLQVADALLTESGGHSRTSEAPVNGGLLLVFHGAMACPDTGRAPFGAGHVVLIQAGEGWAELRHRVCSWAA